MAMSSRGGRKELLHPVPNKWKDREISPERTKVWTEPHPKTKMERKIPVVYYLSRDGHLEHPHFIEVPLTSPEGLYLRDVINRLDSLRGKGMASLYSWSSKRSYKNGFVWHDLSENDFIYPANGQEYVLKGSELLNFKSQEPESSSDKQPEPPKSGGDCSDFPVVVHRRNQSWSSVDLHEYKVYKSELTGDFVGKAADAATQTDDKRRRRRTIREEEEEEEYREESVAVVEDHTTELNREEISPPPSSSSPETLETLIKADCRRLTNASRGAGTDERDLTANNHPSGRIKASAVLMQLISCGSFSVKDGSGGSMTTTPGKDQGFSLISHYGRRLPRGAPNHHHVEMETTTTPNLEDKEYFSGSLIEVKKDQFPALKRSSSYNADRLKLELREEEIDGVRARCIPSKPRKDHSNSINASIICDSSSSHGSKRFGDEPAKQARRRGRFSQQSSPSLRCVIGGVILAMTCLLRNVHLLRENVCWAWGFGLRLCLWPIIKCLFRF